MSTTTVTYQGNLQTAVRHLESGGSFATDVPLEKGGQNTAPSPTDLVAAALGSCLLVTMGMLAKRHELSLAGATATVVKTIAETKPSRIAGLRTTIRIPGGARFTPEQQARLAKATEHCTVHRSLHPEIDAAVEFVWEERAETMNDE